MDNDDKFLNILEKLSEIGERTARMEVTTQVISRDLEVIKAEDRKQNDLLDTHIQGTVANTQRLNLEIKARQEFESRLKKVEKIPQFMASFYKIVVYIGAIIGVIYEVGRILKRW
jgi:hypothetical protein